jgi:hypothetical protein
MADTFPVSSPPGKFSPKDELAAALDTGGEKNISFPKNLVEIDHWMAFRIQRPELLRKDDFPINEDMKRIFLPLPASIGTKYSHDYNTEGIGVAGAAGAKLGSAMVSGGITGMVDSLANVTRSSIVDAGMYYGLQAAEENVGAFVGGAVGKIGGGVFEVAGALAGAAAGQALKGGIAGAGLARNPYMATMYSNPNIRSHSFNWKLIAKSREETDIIRSIIYAFKYHSAPGMKSGKEHFFDYPEQFDIDFHYDKFLYNIGPSVLNSVEVEYHAEGQPLYHDVEIEGVSEKAPLSITLGLQFSEVSIISKEQIKKQNR